MHTRKSERALTRRNLLRSSLALLSGTGFLAACSAQEDAPRPTVLTKSADPVAPQASAGLVPVAFVEVWKTPSCGCCKLWVEHLEKEGFTVKANDVPQTAPMRTRLGIPDDMGSCHTGLVAGLALEGHVPAQDIKRLLAEPASLREQVVGLSVPGMPIGSPGMEEGGKRDAFDVILVLKNGKHRIYQSYSSIT